MMITAMRESETSSNTPQPLQGSSSPLLSKRERERERERKKERQRERERERGGEAGGVGGKK